MTGLNNNIVTELLSGKNQTDVSRAIQILKNGGIVALPTETVYGLAANGFCSRAIAQIYEAKNRPYNNPLIYHVHRLDMAKSLLDESMLQGKPWHRFARLAQKFWPGPLTIVAQRSRGIGDMGCAGLPHIAIRVPDCQVTLTILQNLSFPLVMPSANISTRPSPTKARHVFKTLNQRIHAIVDDGDCTVGIESSVVSIIDEDVKILRPGAISKKDLEECLDEEVYDLHTTVDQTPMCPGQAYLHYSPRVKSISLCAINDIKAAWLSCAQMIGRRRDFALIKECHGERPAHSLSISMSDDAKNFAKELYGALYLAEENGNLDLVVIEPSERNAEWDAIYNRLVRSCTPRQP